jgi:hypothetical protein
MSAPEWRTLVCPHLTEACGCTELHTVFFGPLDDIGGSRPCVGIHIPETPRKQIPVALRLARQHKARVFFLCDTHEQAERIARRAERLLPEYRRISYERAAAGQFGRLA